MKTFLIELDIARQISNNYLPSQNVHNNHYLNSDRAIAIVLTAPNSSTAPLYSLNIAENLNDVALLRNKEVKYLPQSYISNSLMKNCNIFIQDFPKIVRVIRKNLTDLYGSNGNNEIIGKISAILQKYKPQTDTDIENNAQSILSPTENKLNMLIITMLNKHIVDIESYIKLNNNITEQDRDFINEISKVLNFSDN